jgi:hypothetical protein
LANLTPYRLIIGFSRVQFLHSGLAEKYSEIFHNFLTDVRDSWKQNVREKAKNNEDIFDVG